MTEKAKFTDNYPAKADEVVELYNGRFTDVIRGSYYPEGTRLFLKGERIIAIKAAEESDCPQAAYRLDLKGQTVIPGLFNTHCHVTVVVPATAMRLKDLMLLKKHTEKQIERGLADCLLHGVTNVREALTEDLERNRNYSRRIEEGSLHGPRIYNSIHIGPEGGTFTEKPGFLQRLTNKKPVEGIISLPVDASEQQMRDAVDRTIDQSGIHSIKFYDQRFKKMTYKPGARIFSQPQLNAAADQCRRRGIASTVHSISRESFNRAVVAGITSIAHLPFDELLEPGDIRHFLDSDCFIDPTLSVGAFFVGNIKGHASYNHANMLKMEEIRERVYNEMTSEYWIDELQESVLYGYEKLKAGKLKLLGLISLDHMFKFNSGVMTFGLENLKAIAAAGGAERFSAGTDAGASHTSIANMELEYLLMKEYLNFSPAQILRSATIISAKALALEESFGSIEEDKVADLAIIEGDPLSDSSCLGRPVKGLFKAGRLVVSDDSLEVK